MNNKGTIFIAGAATAMVCLYLIDMYRARRRFRKGLEKAIHHASVILEEYEEEERRKNAGSNEPSMDPLAENGS